MAKIGIALGGGAARGLAHIGVIEKLAEAQIPVHIVSGASIGAIVGAIYARRGRVEDVRQRVLEFIRTDIFREASLRLLSQKDSRALGTEDNGWIANITGLLRRGLLLYDGVTGRSVIGEEEFEATFRALIEDVNIESFSLPFAAVAADLVSGDEIVFTGGSVRHAVMASSAIPGVFPPVEDRGRILVDGGWIDVVPIEACRKLGADFVIGVDIGREIEERVDFRRSINIFLRSNSITRQKLRELQAMEADFLIRPAVGDMHWADFSNIDKVIELGAEAASQSLKALLRAISTKKRKKWLGL